MARTRIAPVLTAAIAAAVLGGTVVGGTVAAAPASAAGITYHVVSPTGSVTMYVKGNGHGHGLSQYGARGAALAGLSAAEIAAFYYPHTTLTTLPRSWIRVRLSGYGLATTVAACSYLTVHGVSGYLPTTGISRYRLIADSGSALTLQYLRSAPGSVWTTYRTGLANGAYFHRSNFYSIRQYASDGTSTYFFGALGAFRNAASGSSGGVYTVNTVTLDHYTAGVVPREMPASWPAAAVQAQALAARSYGRYGVEHPQSSRYDICDNTQCQVYGGHVHLSSSGAVLWTDDNDAILNNLNQVLQYGGHTIFSQFAASDGGWTTDGGQPYLTAHADPYDNSASADPYLIYTHTSSAGSLASDFGLKTLTGIAIVSRDGNGTWGGRVTSASVRGTDSANHVVTKSITGYDLQYAFGVGSTWMQVS